VHEARRQAFLAIAEAEPERCKVVAADRPQEEIAEDIGALVSELLKKKGLL
jgi:dTMP kinase